MHTIRQPVTLGSRVPLWPVFSTLYFEVMSVYQLLHATLNDDHHDANIPQDTLDPGNDLVTGGIGGLVEVDNAGADVRLDVTLQWRRAIGDRCEVTGSHED